MSEPSPGPEVLSRPAPPGSYRSDALGVLLRLNWFIRLRWLFVALALGVLAAERFAFPGAARPWQLLLVVLAVAAVNVIWILAALAFRQHVSAADASPETQRAGQVFANAQVSADLLLLTAILHYTGGVENPMAVFYLFHVAISGLLLRPRHALLQSCWAVVLYSLMAGAEWQGALRHYLLLPQLGSPGLYENREYTLLLIIVNACAILGTLYFTLRIARLVDAHAAALLRANDALEQSRRAIQDLQQRRARFMQTAAHQLKGPLAIVQTLANLIRDGLVVDPAGIRTTCEKISRRAAEGITQVSELLTLARVQDADPARARRSQVDVRAVIDDLSRKYTPLADQKHIKLTTWLPLEADLFVNLDPQDFRDCIGNLIENAIKYTPGPGRVRVAVTAKSEGDRTKSVAVHVSDTGIGLDPALLRSAGKVLGDEPIFEAFRRGPNVVAAGIPGSGLGLSIVREVVEQAGGRIWVMSRPGFGSSFTVTFPASGSADEPPPARDTRAASVILELPADAAKKSGPAA